MNDKDMAVQAKKSSAEHGADRTPAVCPYPLYRLSLPQYRRMAEIGILTKYDRVELLEGWLVARPPASPAQATSTSITADVLQKLVPRELHLRTKSAISDIDSEPEPDISIVDGPLEKYVERRPKSGEVQMVVEVSDASLDVDLWKAGIYASYAVPTFWLVNLVDRQIEVHRGPLPAKRLYRERRIYEPGESTPVVFMDREVARVPVARFLPPVK
jgi:Uma2 family endonuclease